MNYVALFLGIALGLVFIVVMVCNVLPAADHIVKRERGTVEACFLTRFCCLCIGLPFYVFTIWMTLVILLDNAPGISVLQEICGDDYGCANTFAMGRTSHDKTACTNADCGIQGFQARSGAQPLNFPRFGLGQELDLINETVSFRCSSTDEVTNACLEITEVDVTVHECVARNDKTGICLEFNSVKIGSGDSCACSYFDQSGICLKFDGCNDDISPAVYERSCTPGTVGCDTFDIETDSAKQFSFQSCVCNPDDQRCVDFTCDIVTMEYYYPNVFYAGAATILFVLPMMIMVYTLMKTHLRKLIPCGEAKLFVYSQEAGIQEETTAENLAAGGYTKDQEQKGRYRKFSWKDVGMMSVGTGAMVFFSWVSVLVAGRVGLAFVALAASLIAVYEIVGLVRMFRRFSSNMEDREERNLRGNNYS